MQGEEIQKMQDDTDNKFFENRKALRVYDEELKRLGLEINKAFNEIDLKVPLTDGQRIWKNFQRFAEYDDLKELYSKVLPEIGKFETKLMQFD